MKAEWSTPLEGPTLERSVAYESAVLEHGLNFRVFGPSIEVQEYCPTPAEFRMLYLNAWTRDPRNWVRRS